MLLNIINYHQAFYIQNYFLWKGCEAGLNLHVGSFSLTEGFSRERSENKEGHSTMFKDEDWERVLWGWRINLSCLTHPKNHILLLLKKKQAWV